MESAANRLLAGSPPLILLRRRRRRSRRRGVGRAFLHPVVVMMAHVMMVFPVMMAVMVACRHWLFWRIRDRLHGRLGERRSPNERGDGDRRHGNAWKLHGVSLVR
jgi:hypothetical protein